MVKKCPTKRSSKPVSSKMKRELFRNIRITADRKVKVCVKKSNLTYRMRVWKEYLRKCLE